MSTAPESADRPAPAPPEAPRGRLRRALGRVGSGLGLGAVFLTALTGGALLHLNLPPARRQIERTVRSVLNGVFEGSVEVQGVRHLGLDGVALEQVVVRDPSGVEVLHARGLLAEASVPTLLWSLVGGGDLHVTLALVRIEELDVRADPDERDGLTIARAFSPRSKGEPTPSRPFYFDLKRAEIGTASVHGQPAGPKPLDAELRRLAGSVHIEPGELAIDLEPMGVIERTELPGVLSGTVFAHLTLLGPKNERDTTTPSVTRAWGGFGGRIGGVDIVANGLMDGAHVELAAHAPKASPAQVKALLPTYPLDDTVAVSAIATGDLPNLDFTVSARTEHRGSAGAEGHVVLGKPLKGDVTFHTEALDPRAAEPNAPALLVTSRGKAHAEIGVTTTFRGEVETEPTDLNGTPIPGVSATAAYDGSSWSGKAKVHEPGAPVDASFTMQEDGAVHFEATARAASLASVDRLRKAKLRGSATVHASGVVRGTTLDASVGGSVRSFRAGSDVAVDRASLRGRIHGPFTALAVEATVTAADAHAGSYGVEDAVVRISGQIQRPFVRVHAIDSNKSLVDLAAAVDTTTGAAQRIRLRIEREGSIAEGSIARIGTRSGSLAIEGIAIDTPQFGKVNGSLRIVRGELAGALHAVDLDLGAIRKFLGLPRNLAGKADIDIELAPARIGRTGSMRIAVREGAVDAAPGVLMTGVSASLNAAFDGEHVSGAAEVSLAGSGDRCSGSIARVKLARGDGRIQGPLLSGGTWTGATGHVDVAAEDFDLSCLATTFMPLGLPVSEIFGIVSAKATLARDKDHRFPSVHDLTASTRYLSITGPQPADPTAAPWSSRDVDVEVKGDIDGDTGRATLSTALFDYAALATIDLGATLDLDALADPRRRKLALQGTRVAGHASIPRRKLSEFNTLPSFVRDKIPSLLGETSIDAYFAGSVAAPKALVRVLGWDVAPGPTTAGLDNPWAVPVDVDAAAFYDGSIATLDAHVSHNHREILLAKASLDAPVDKLAGTQPLHVTGSGSVLLSNLPLADVPMLGDRSIGGHLSGSAQLEGLGTEPRLSVDLRSSDLTAGADLAFSEVRATLETRRSKGSADVVLLASTRLVDKKGGGLDASGYVGLGWKTDLVPVLQKDKPGDLYARFHRFRLAVAEPLLAGAVRNLDGFLDGVVRVSYRTLDQREKGVMDADLRVTEGAVYVPQIGQGLHLVNDGNEPLHITADRTGLVKIEHLVAQASSGKVSASATLHLDGFSLQDATGKLVIAEGAALPITLEGVDRGAAYGTIDVQARREAVPEKHASRMAVYVTSKDLHFQIPASSSRDVQSLEPNPDIRILQPQEPPAEPKTRDGQELAITIRLENTVIEGDGIRITLSSFKDTPPVFVTGNGTRASGDIRLVKGTLEVIGRKFELDQGTVHLQEDPSNPYLNVTAHWDAPDGSTIFVDYVGRLTPITQNKLRFRSTVPRTQQQALAMLLFGSESGGAVTTGGGDTQGGNAVGQAAVGVGGELAAQQFNQLLKGIAPLKGLSTRFGTTEGGGMKGSIVYQVGDTVSAVATYQGSTAAGSSSSTPGSAGSSSAPGASVSVDWRFYRNWLIRASVGTAADIPKGEIDLLWQYRY